MEGGTDPISFPTAARCSTSTIAVGWNLKVRDIEHNVGLTKNYYLIASMQKNKLNS